MLLRVCVGAGMTLRDISTFVLERLGDALERAYNIAKLEAIPEFPRWERSLLSALESVLNDMVNFLGAARQKVQDDIEEGPRIVEHQDPVHAGPASSCTSFCDVQSRICERLSPLASSTCCDLPLKVPCDQFLHNLISPRGAPRDVPSKPHKSESAHCKNQEPSHALNRICFSSMRSCESRRGRCARRGRRESFLSSSAATLRSPNVCSPSSALGSPGAALCSMPQSQYMRARRVAA